MRAQNKSIDEVANKNAVRVGYLIHDVSRLRRTVYDQKLKPLGITRSQWWVLVNLSRHSGEGFTQIELARLLDVGKVTVGGLLDRLEDNGLVRRVQDKADRRSKRVFVSDKGEALIHVLEHEATFINKDIMRGISSSEHALLADTLAKMKRNLIEMEADSSSTAGQLSK